MRSAIGKPCWMAGRNSPRPLFIIITKIYKSRRMLNLNMRAKSSWRSSMPSRHAPGGLRRLSICASCRRLTLGLNAGYLNAQYTDFEIQNNPVLSNFNFNGTAMTNAPKWQIGATAALDQPLTGRAAPDRQPSSILYQRGQLRPGGRPLSAAAQRLGLLAHQRSYRGRFGGRPMDRPVLHQQCIQPLLHHLWRIRRRDRQRARLGEPAYHGRGSHV